jgi:hypothetical protein
MTASPALAQTASDYVTHCHSADTQWCESSKKQFIKEYPEALKGDYQAQRNVSFCLNDGCDGSVQKNKTLGCAWRLVLLASGSPKVNELDVRNWTSMCTSKLDTLEMSIVRSQANSLFQTVYGRDLPAGF